MTNRVGIVSSEYPQKRTIIGFVEGIHYKKVWDFYSVIHALSELQTKVTKIPVTTVTDYNFQFNDFTLNNVDLFHFFNMISYGRTPWISTYETILPRFSFALSCHHGRNPNFSSLKDNTKIRLALETISAKPCKYIIALSECNATMQREFLKEFPEYQEKILKKMLVLHPPQKALVSAYSAKNIDVNGKIRFIFVGASFFQKGGLEIVETLKMVKEKYHYPLELILISSLEDDNYAAQASAADNDRVLSYILENSDWITYFPRLENNQVLAWMKKSHIGLLPTYADTYGFVVLEYQAAGCPVISTNVRALPEINSDDTGWMIEIPKNYLGEAIYTTQEDRALISTAIRQGLEQAVHEIFSDKKIILEKSEKSIRNIEKNHSVQNYSRQLSEIYHKAWE
jgi:glycosyltransferase involved in cell wall biosynthesis